MPGKVVVTKPFHMRIRGRTNAQECEYKKTVPLNMHNNFLQALIVVEQLYKHFTALVTGHKYDYACPFSAEIKWMARERISLDTRLIR